MTCYPQGVTPGEVSLVATPQCWDHGQVAGNIESRVLRNNRDCMVFPEDIPYVMAIKLLHPG